jgi:hypothetical protein
MKRVAGQSARVETGKAENDAEAADAGSKQNPFAKRRTADLWQG